VLFADSCRFVLLAFIHCHFGLRCVCRRDYGLLHSTGLQTAVYVSGRRLVAVYPVGLVDGWQSLPTFFRVLGIFPRSCVLSSLPYFGGGDFVSFLHVRVRCRVLAVRK